MNFSTLNIHIYHKSLCKPEFLFACESTFTCVPSVVIMVNMQIFFSSSRQQKLHEQDS